MDFITEMGFDVVKGKAKEFQEWLAKNGEKLGESAPEGWEYLGTYAVMISTEKEAGDYRQLWRHHSYGAQDTFAAAMRGDGPFAKLNDEMATQFMDQDKGAHFSQSLLKSVIDASFWGEG